MYGGMSVDVVSIVFIVIILVFCLLGFFQGFFALLLGFAKGLVALLVAVLLCKPLGSVLASTGMGNGIAGGVENWLVEKNEVLFHTVLNPENAADTVNQGLEAAKIPSMVRPYITGLLQDKVPNTDGMALGEYIAKGVAIFACIMIAFFVVLIIAGIILAILQKVLKNINRIPIVGLVNRILGLAMGALLACLVISGICYALSFFMGIPGDISTKLVDMLRLGEGQEAEWTVAKFFYQHNPLQWLFAQLFS